MPRSGFEDTFQAGAAVTAHRFVKQNGTTVNSCILGTANAVVLGVAREGAIYTDGDIDVPVVQSGTAELELGDTVTLGTDHWLKSDSVGRGVPIVGGSTQNVGCRPLEGGVVGDIIKVEVVVFSSYPTSAGVSCNVIADPGNAGTIVVTESGLLDIVTAGAETRVLPAPTFVGQTMLISMKTDVGDCVIAIATLINQAGNNRITLNDAGDAILLIAKTSGSSKLWSVVSNDGCTLSTV